MNPLLKTREGVYPANNEADAKRRWSRATSTKVCPILSITPNPFTNLTTIRYNVPISGKVSVKLYNSTGKLISILVNENKPTGSYSLEIRNSILRIPSGIYFLRYEDKTNQKEIKLIIE